MTTTSYYNSIRHIITRVQGYVPHSLVFTGPGDLLYKVGIHAVVGLHDGEFATFRFQISSYNDYLRPGGGRDRDSFVLGDEQLFNVGNTRTSFFTVPTYLLSAYLFDSLTAAGEPKDEPPLTDEAYDFVKWGVFHHRKLDLSFVAPKNKDDERGNRWIGDFDKHKEHIIERSSPDDGGGKFLWTRSKHCLSYMFFAVDNDERPLLDERTLSANSI